MHSTQMPNRSPEVLHPNEPRYPQCGKRGRCRKKLPVLEEAITLKTVLQYRVFISVLALVPRVPGFKP